MSQKPKESIGEEQKPAFSTRPEAGDDEAHVLHSFDSLLARIQEELLHLENPADLKSVTYDLSSMEQLLENLSIYNGSLIILQHRTKELMSILFTLYRHLGRPSQSEPVLENFCTQVKELIKRKVSGLLHWCLKQQKCTEIILDPSILSKGTAYTVYSFIQFVLPEIVKKGPSDAPHWFAVNEEGQLSIVKQCLGSLEFMLPEVLLPREARIKEGPCILYGQALVNLSTMMMCLPKKEMGAFCDTLLTFLSSPYPFVGLFASDLFGFMAKIAPSPWTFYYARQIIALLHESIRAKSSNQELIAATCSRMLKEIDAVEKLSLLDYIPVGKNFYVWSHIDAASFLDCPEILKQLFEESTCILRKLLRLDKESLPLFYHAQFCRLPLALRCLSSLFGSARKVLETTPELKQSIRELFRQFVDLWQLVSFMPIQESIVANNVAHLLNLGGNIANDLSDTTVLTILERIRNWPEVPGIGILISSTANFLSGIVSSKKLSKPILEAVIQTLEALAANQSCADSSAIMHCYLSVFDVLNCAKFAEDCAKNCRSLQQIAVAFVGICESQVLPQKILEDIAKLYADRSKIPKVVSHTSSISSGSQKASAL